MVSSATFINEFEQKHNKTYQIRSSNWKEKELKHFKCNLKSQVTEGSDNAIFLETSRNKLMLYKQT